MNVNNNAIKRIMADVKELAKHPSPRYSAAPLEHNVFEWHFSIRGPSETDFEGGTYHGRILLPAEYPFKPPNIIFLTKTGRFEVGTKICLSISAYHEESWQPAWGVRTMLEAIISFLPSEGAGSIGSLEYSKAERQKLAKESVAYCCPCCGPIAALLSDPDVKEEVDSEVANQISQLRMASALSPGKGPSEAHTALKADTQEEGKGNTLQTAFNISNTDTIQDTDKNQNFVSATETFKSAEKGESVPSGLSLSDGDNSKTAFSHESCEECSSAHTRDVHNSETATSINTKTHTINSADTDRSSNLEGNGRAYMRNVDDALSSTAAPTNRAAGTLPDTNTNVVVESQHDLTDRVLTALLYIIGALILFIVFKRALLFGLYNGKDDPGLAGGEL